MLDAADIIVNPENQWRLEAPEPKGWARDVKRDSPKKYFIVSCDTHLNPPNTLFRDRLDKKWHDLLAKVEVRDGRKYLIQPGARPLPMVEFEYEGEDLLRAKAGSVPEVGLIDGKIKLDTAKGRDRIQEQEFDGVDAEVIFPNGAALFMWSSNNNEFANAQAQIWNDWAWEVCGPFADRSHPVACLVTADVEMAVAEVERAAKKGYRILCLPCKPIWGPANVADINYNLPIFDPLWAAIQDHDMAITFHASTGKDPRTARGNGGAIINFVAHAMTQPFEPLVNMCASGVFERFSKLRVASIEADAGWVPWLMDKMDDAYKTHHFWVRPKLKEMPSEYFRNHCYASVMEDRSAVMQMEEYGLQDNLMWANDYPHHEGTWPHSAQSIYRTLGDLLKEETRAKLLGLNAAKCFRFPIPDRFK